MPGGGRGGRSGGMGFDPNVIFNMMAKGKEVIVVDELDDRTKSRMAPMLQAMGITNGQITRDQYAQAFEKMRSGGFGAMTAPATSPTGSASPSTITLSPGSGRPGFSGGGPGGTDYSGGGSDAFAESMFRRLDKNNDGVLDADEMPESLRAEKEKWDTNKDGVIDPTEFKAFFAARLLALQTERAANQNAAAASDPEDEHDKKPVIY